MIIKSIYLIIESKTIFKNAVAHVIRHTIAISLHVNGILEKNDSPTRTPLKKNLLRLYRVIYCRKSKKIFSYSKRVSLKWY